MNAQAKIEASIVGVLAKVLPELGAVHKNKKNPAFKSNYADLGAVLTAIAPIAEHGLWFRQVPVRIDGGVGIETFYVHESGDELSAGITPIPVDKNNAQALGSAMSYGRRYGLMTAFGLSADDDDGNAASRQQNSGRDNTGDRQASPPGTIHDADLTLAIQLCDTIGGNQAQTICEAYKVSALTELTEPQGKAVVKRLQEKLADKAKVPANA